MHRFVHFYFCFSVVHAEKTFITQSMHVCTRSVRTLGLKLITWIQTVICHMGNQTTFEVTLNIISIGRVKYGNIQEPNIQNYFLFTISFWALRIKDCLIYLCGTPEFLLLLSFITIFFLNGTLFFCRWFLRRTRNNPKSK